MPKKIESKKEASSANQRFNRVDQKLDQLDQETHQLGRKISELDQKVDRVDQKTNQLDHKINALDQKVDRVDQKTDRLDHKINELDQKVDRVEAKLAAGIARNEGKIDRLKHELMDFIKENTSRILQTVEGFAVQYQKQDRQLVLHGHRLEDHEQRIAAVEEKVR